MTSSSENDPLAERPQSALTHLKLRSDEELMAACVSGSQDAFRVLVERYQSRIINLVYRYIGDRNRAEDIAQEVFLRVFVHRKRYRQSGRFSTWIFTIAANLAKNEIRRIVRLRGSVEIDTVEGTAGGPGNYITDGAPGPDIDVSRAELSSIVARAVRKLPPKYREALVLRDLEGLSYEEIGEILKIPGGTVRSRINRARLSLREKLAGYAKRDLT
jgi:RNA polymerase sigma-70 factor (ECF subfamily)